MTKINKPVLVFILLIPILVLAQSSTRADAAWTQFWSQFTAAVNAKNKAAVKQLMVPEKDFFAGGGAETRDQWLRLVDKQKWWSWLQRSVRSGTKPFADNGLNGRVTKDNGLIFVLKNNRWRFLGPMGD